MLTVTVCFYSLKETIVFLQRIPWANALFWQWCLSYNVIEWESSGVIRVLCSRSMLSNQPMFIAMSDIILDRYIESCWYTIPESKAKHYTYYDLAPWSLSCSGSGSRSGSFFKMNNFWTIYHYLFKKTWFLYTLTCCLRPKMHKLKVHVGDN